MQGEVGTEQGGSKMSKLISVLFHGAELKSCLTTFVRLGKPTRGKVGRSEEKLSSLYNRCLFS